MGVTIDMGMSSHPNKRTSLVMALRCGAKKVPGIDPQPYEKDPDCTFDGGCKRFISADGSWWLSSPCSKVDVDTSLVDGSLRFGSLLDA